MTTSEICAERKTRSVCSPPCVCLLFGHVRKSSDGQASQKIRSVLLPVESTSSTVHRGRGLSTRVLRSDNCMC